MPNLVNSLQLTVNSLKKSVNRQLFTLSEVEGTTDNRKASGFTLIELLVVISIIAILVAAASSSWTNAQKKSRDGKRKSDLKSTQQALELYFQRNGQYPGCTNFQGCTDPEGTIRCNVDGDESLIRWGGDFTCGTVGTSATYMNPLPKDPINKPAQHFVYFYEKDDKNGDLRPDTYKISALLENAKDPDNKDGPNYQTGTLPCSPAPSYNYCVINP